MGDRYEQLSLEERCSIARLREAGQSSRQIAAALDRTPSTISRELKRNTGKHVGYQPGYAEQQTRARRWSGSRLEREDGLRDDVLARLAAGWSPEQIAGRLAREAGRSIISYESIYRFIYAQLRRTNDGAWRLYLPRAKARRGWRGKRGGSPASFIQHRRPIDDRPSAAGDRRSAGHWEADFMLFASYGQSLLVTHERASRVTLVARTPNRKAETTANALAGLLAPLPQCLRATITFDNGTEFAQHYRLHQQLGVQTFFCDTHSPCKKAVSKMPSDASGATCPDRQTSIASPASNSTRSPAPTTSHPENASTSKPRSRHCPITRCTSNVNPHPGFRRDGSPQENSRPSVAPRPRTARTG